MTPKKGWTGNPDGRPPLADESKRRKNRTITFTEEEYDALNEHYKKSGIRGLGKFISKRINGFYTGEKDKK